MITGKEILLGFVVPVVLTLMGLLAAAFAWRSQRGKLITVAKLALVSLLPAGAYALGFWGIYGRPGWVPVDTTLWLLHFSVIAGVVGMLSSGVRWLSWACRLGMVIVFPWLLLKPIIQYDWTVPIAVAWVAAFAVAMFVQMVLLEQIGRKVETSRFLLIVTTLVGLTALILSLSGSIALGKRSGILAMMLLAGFMVSRWLPRTRFATYLIPLVTIVTSGLWLCGYYYAELDKVNACLLYGSVVLAWIGLWLGLEKRSFWSRLVLHTLLVVLPLAIAMVRAFLVFRSQNQTNNYY